MGEEIELQQPVTDEAVKAYYEKNSAHFSQPQGLRLFRVLLGGERQAKALIAEAQKPDGLERWSRFAREHSLDKATHLRRGDLGFVHANGETDVPRVQVDPVLFEAAQRVPDGAVVPEPVPEAGKLAVVWRRGSRPERKRSLAEERDAIRAMLERDRVAEAEAQLIARLERKHVTEHHPERLEIFPEGPLAEPVPRGRPALRARASDAGVSPPVQTERGLR